MIYSTDYIPGVPEERIKYCGFLTYNLFMGTDFHFPNWVREFPSYVSELQRERIINQNQDIMDLINEYGGNALIGVKLVAHTAGSIILYGTVVKVED